MTWQLPKIEPSSRLSQINMDEGRELLLTGRMKLVAGSPSPNSGRTLMSIDEITAYILGVLLYWIFFLKTLDEIANPLEQSFVEIHLEPNLEWCCSSEG